MYKTFSKISIFLSLSAIFLLAGCGKTAVQTVKIEAEANQIIDILNEYGISAEKNPAGEGERRTYEILVDGDSRTRALAIQLMEDHCLAQPQPPEVEGGTVITSTEVEKQREYRRMKMNIETQLRQLPGVTCVNVNFVPPQDRALAINPYPSTASVLINYKSEAFPVGKDDIASLVAKSVPALQPDNVSVVISAKPLRPLPDNRGAYNFTRIALISGLGFATILAFVSVVFFLQKRRRNRDLAEDELEDYDDENEDSSSALLEDGYEFEDDDEENDGLHLP